MTHVYHHQTKFRWTENLTCRFIQLRKENGKLFTGRKYSAQAGWEFILRQMREEFPTIMADVHYRVLKKKWSNLLQQYKELKNPVHGDRNKADDVSWPFYNAIDEVLGHGQRSNDDEEEEDIVDPHEFLCVSVTLEEGNHPDAGSETDDESCKDAVQSGLMTALQQRTRTINEDRNRSGSNNTIVPLSIADLRKRASKMETKKRNVDDDPTSRLPRATQLSIEPSSRSTSISVKDLSKLRTNVDRNEPAHNGHLSTPCVDVDDANDVVRPVKKARRTRTRPTDHHKEHQCVLESRLTEFLEYAKQRDEENRSIMTSILQAVEKIANKF